MASTNRKGKNKRPSSVKADSTTCGKPASRNQEILRVATTTFARYGYRNTDVQFIADELGIGKGTIYRNFPTKQELFFACLDRGMERLHEHMTAVFEADLSPLEKVKASTRAYFAFFEDNADLVELFIQERAEFRDRPQVTYFIHKERNMCRAGGLLSELASEKAIRDIDLDSLQHVLSSLFFGTLFVHYFSRQEMTLTARAEEIIDVVVMNILKNPKPEPALSGR